jgi:hypothetical protein
MTVDEAIDIVARRALAYAADDIADEAWDMYPEIGEFDWEAVAGRVRALAPHPPHETYLEAYAFLKARAEHTA